MKPDITEGIQEPVPLYQQDFINFIEYLLNSYQGDGREPKFIDIDSMIKLMNFQAGLLSAENPFVDGAFVLKGLDISVGIKDDLWDCIDNELFKVKENNPIKERKSNDKRFLGKYIKRKERF